MKLIPWVDFRQMIYDIYDHRVCNAPEISGSLNTSYLGLDEHLLVYLVHKHQSRSETEFHLLKFLLSLRYYSVEVRWARALIYANMLGFLEEP